MILTSSSCYWDNIQDKCYVILMFLIIWKKCTLTFLSIIKIPFIMILYFCSAFYYFNHAWVCNNIFSAIWTSLSLIKLMQKANHHKHVSIFHSFWWLNRILLYGYTTMLLIFHHLVEIWIVSSLGLLKVILPWVSMCLSFCEYLFSFLLVRFLGVKFQGSMISLCLSL